VKLLAASYPIGFTKQTSPVSFPDVAIAHPRNPDPMTNFRDRFQTMLAELEAHPEIEVFASEVRPPASASDLARAQAFLEMPLPPDMRAFYETCDGVFLQWGLRGHKYEPHGAFEYPDYQAPPGAINLLPIAQVMSSHWVRESHVNEVQTDQQEHIFGTIPEVPIGAVCIDNFSKYHHADLILGPTPVMIVATDHGADLEASDWVSFATYLDMTLGLFGANRYTFGIGIGWSRDPEHRPSWTPTLNLGDLLAKIAEEET